MLTSSHNAVTRSAGTNGRASARQETVRVVQGRARKRSAANVHCLFALEESSPFVEATTVRTSRNFREFIYLADKDRVRSGFPGSCSILCLIVLISPISPSPSITNGIGLAMVSSKPNYTNAVLFHPREWFLCWILFFALGVTRIWIGSSYDPKGMYNSTSLISVPSTVSLTNPFLS
jgi:hypothetical protein